MSKPKRKPASAEVIDQVRRRPLNRPGGGTDVAAGAAAHFRPNNLAQERPEVDAYLVLAEMIVASYRGVDARMMEEGETMDLTGAPTHAEQMSDSQFKENMEDEELRDDIQ